MIRFPFIPFLTAAAVTSVLTYQVWLSRETSLTPAPPPQKIVTQPPPAVPAASSGPAAFEEFRKHTGAERDLKYLDSLDASAMAGMAGQAAAVQEAETYGNGLIEDFACRWMELDPDAAVEWVLALPSGPVKNRAISAAFSPWTDTDPKAAAKWFRERSGHRPWEVLRGDEALKEKWGDIARQFLGGDIRDVKDIAADLAALPKEARERVAPDSLVTQLSSEWNVAMDTGGLWREGLEVLQGILSNPGHALSEWAENQAASLLQEVLKKDPALVMAWIANHPRNAAADGRAAEALSELLNPDLRTRAAKEYGTANWPTADETVEWFLKLPRTIKEKSALEVLIQSWAAYDQAAAGNFLNRQAQGPDTDQARWALALSTANVDPPAALEWAQSIADQSLRSQTRQDVLTAWKRYDPTEAAAYEAGKQTPGEPEP